LDVDAEAAKDGTEGGSCLDRGWLAIYEVLAEWKVLVKVETREVRTLNHNSKGGIKVIEEFVRCIYPFPTRLRDKNDAAQSLLP
jgi:hypothetical protein